MPVVCTFGPNDILATPKRPEGERRLLDSKDPLARSGKLAGAKLWEATDGRILGEFPTATKNLRIPVEWPNRAAAEAGLQHLNDLARQEGLLTAASRRQGNLMRLDVPDEVFDIRASFPELRLDEHLYGEVDVPLGDPHRFITGKASVNWGKMVQVRSGLKGMGETGQMISEMFDRVQELKTRITGRLHQESVPLLDALSDAEKANWFDLRAAGRQADMTPAQRAFDQWFTARSSQALESGLKVGLDVPHVFDANTYVPHLHDMVLLQDTPKLDRMVKAMIKKGLASDKEGALKVLEEQGYGTSRDRAIGAIMEGFRRNGADVGKTLDQLRAEAGAILDRFISRRQIDRSRHLEHERLADLPPIKDPHKIVAAYFTDTSERLAQAEVFGPGYERMDALINKLPDERMRQFARDVLTLEVNGPAERPHGFLRFLHNWQANKLSLSVFANAGQQINTLQRSGFKAFAKAFFDVGKDLARGRFTESDTYKNAKMVGAFTDRVMDEFTQAGAGWLFEGNKMALSLPERAIQKATDISLALFNKVEQANRMVAVRAGEHYFDAVLADLRAKPQDPRAMKRLKELGMDPAKVLAASPEDLTQMQLLAGRRMSDMVQFAQRSSQTRPLWANHPIGGLLYQFKSFTINQASYMTNEIFGSHGDNARRFRALGLMATAMPAYGYGLMLFKDAVLGKSFAGDQVHELMKDPGFKEYVAAGAVLMASQGALGITSDLAMSALTGNEFAIRSFFIPPTFSSAISAVSIGGSVVRGTVNQFTGSNSPEFSRAIRTASREFGGLGSTAANWAERAGVLAPSGKKKKRRSSFGGGGGGFGG